MLHECNGNSMCNLFDFSVICDDYLVFLKKFYVLGVLSKNTAGKLNLAPLRPRAAPMAPMGRHDRSGGQIFNGIVFGGDVGTIYTISPPPVHALRTVDRRNGVGCPPGDVHPSSLECT